MKNVTPVDAFMEVTSLLRADVQSPVHLGWEVTWSPWSTAAGAPVLLDGFWVWSHTHKLFLPSWDDPETPFAAVSLTFMTPHPVCEKAISAAYFPWYPEAYISPGREGGAVCERERASSPADGRKYISVQADGHGRTFILSLLMQTVLLLLLHFRVQPANCRNFRRKLWS